MSAFTELTARLQQELNCVQSLLQTLETEKFLLETRDLSQLQPLLSTKSELLNQLERLQQSRQAWLKNQGLTTSDKELVTHLESSDERDAQLAREVLAEYRIEIDKCNYFNELNGILIINSQKRNSRKLDIMRGISKEQKLYTASGGTTARTSQNDVGRA